MVKIVLRLEGLIVLLASLYFYYYINGDWLVFTILFFAPDISMIGYLKDKKIGAVIYNLIHNFVLSFILIFSGMFFGQVILIALGLILSAHVGLDRLVGYGLKYPADFKETHMQKV